MNQKIDITPLPSDPHEFYRMSAQVDLPPTDAQATPTLEKLGQPAFPRGRFPFLGFLASVYDHVVSHARKRTASEQASPTDQ
ncbi:MAG: hypothetical protein IT448_08880 [Phycisphaerales bacterium]|nr:hypothetical protein [Phycisphaerales bacterium]